MAMTKTDYETVEKAIKNMLHIAKINRSSEEYINGIKDTKEELIEQFEKYVNFDEEKFRKATTL